MCIYYHIYLVINRCFSLPNSPQNLDPSYKAAVDFWDCFMERKTFVILRDCFMKRKTFVILTAEIFWIDEHVWENPHLIVL